MKINSDAIQKFILDLLFPKFCLNCRNEGEYLCQDCLALLDILESSYCLCEKPFRLPVAGKCDRCRAKKMDGLYFAVSYQNRLAKKMIHRFKYSPFAKELADDLAYLIIAHLQLLNKTNFDGFVLIPVPLHIKRMKWRGYNQSEELAKKLSFRLKIPLSSDSLIRTKETSIQAELNAEERKNNVKESFAVKNKNFVQNKKILLVDDVYTTGTTMEECSLILKKAGAKEVWGVAVSRD